MHDSFIHSNQKLKAIQIPNDLKMYKQIAAYPYKKYYSTIKRNNLTDNHNNIDDSHRYYAPLSSK